MRRDVEQLVEVYAAALSAGGPTPQGLLWPAPADLAARLETLLAPADLGNRTAADPVRLLDLGCGPGLLLDYLSCNGLLDRVDYVGVDVFEATLAIARARWPQHRFELRDVRDAPLPPHSFDWALICGVFTGRFALGREQMERLAHETLEAVWPAVRTGVTFNVMSKHVDWERDDLFHWPLDAIMAFCKARLSRHTALRLDYGLWETAVCVRRTPVARVSHVPASWFGNGADGVHVR